jgi:hypothetical protein
LAFRSRSLVFCEKISISLCVGPYSTYPARHRARRCAATTLHVSGFRSSASALHTHAESPRQPRADSLWTLLELPFSSLAFKHIPDDFEQTASGHSLSSPSPTPPLAPLTTPNHFVDLERTAVGHPLRSTSPLLFRPTLLHYIRIERPPCRAMHRRHDTSTIQSELIEVTYEGTFG